MADIGAGTGRERLGSIYAKEEMVQRLLEKYKKARKKTTVIHD